MGPTEQSHRTILLRLFNTAVDAVKPATAIANAVAREGEILQIRDIQYDLRKYDRIYLVGAGKASAFMARSMEEILGERVTAGIINVKYGHGTELSRCRINECGHPVPDQNGLAGTREIFELLESTDERTCVICLISGGGSALLPYPAESISLDDLKLLNQLLLECGADISEVNTVRKHISRSKGGRLALAAFPADVVTVIISDVIGNPLDMIASGPTVPDPTTYRDAMKVLTKYKITGRVPETVIAVLRGGLDGRLPETLKPGDSRFEKVRTAIIAENGVALKAACDEARRVGFEPSIISIPMQGEAKVAAAGLIDNVKRLLAAGGRRDKPTCLISGGETTVTIKGRGKGGRNTEFALAAAIELQDLPGVALLSCGTDGTDGPTDAAGAYCDQSTIKRALDGGLDPEKFLSQNNSYTFFSELDDLIITGPTGTNVMDIQIVLIDPR